MSRGLQKTFRAAVAHHQAGRLSQAEALYRRIIAGQPNEAETLRLLGVIAHQRGCQEEAEQWARQAISACGRPVAEFCNTLGAVLAAQGKPGEAVRCYQEAVALKQDYPEAHQNLGRTLAALGRMEEAAPHFEKALHLRPGDATAHHDMGSVFAHRKMAAEAMACFEKAVQLDPRNADAWNNLGNTLHRQGRLAEAIACFRRALALQPALAAAHNNLGVMLQEQGARGGDPQMAAEAMACFEKAVQLDPRNADAWNNLGNMRRARGRVAEAIVCVQKALALQPGFAAAYSNLGVMLHEQGKVDEAILSLQQALALEPNDAAAWSNLGNCLMEAQRFAEALSGYDRAIELQPGFLRARWHRSLVLFMTGEIERGWIEYEWGWADGQRTQPRPFGQPRWDGSPLIGTRLLFWGEQGVGDEIIWAGMIPELGDRHIVECEPRLVPLFARSFPGVEVIPREIPPHPTTALADLQIPAASAGRWLRASLDRFPRHHGYLRADPERVAHWRQWLDTLGPGLAIGICWRSGVTAGLRNLSCTNLQQWGSVLSVPGVHFINLQYDECRAELDQARAHFGVRIHEFSGIDLRQDLDDVAALTTALDLVVSTTTAVADMAGALGRPVWVLMLTSAGHGFTMGQHYVPWFPSMRLYERTWNEPWEPVLKRLSQDLADLASREAAVPDTAPTLWPLLPSGR
jgi:tetratricopeptide (TPR) repeat protein